MRTTTKQAYTIYKIITQVNPFEYGTDEKPFIIKELKELLKDGSLNDAICKAGAIGEYHFICDSIYQDEENVYKLYVINYCIQESISIDEDLIDEIANECICKCSKFYDILCAIEEAQESEDQE